LPTDRFYVEWWVTSNRVVGKLSSERGPLNLDAYLNGGAKLVNEAKIREDNLLAPPEDFIHSQKRILMAEIPANIQEIKRTDKDLAIAWRYHSRQLFEHYFDHDYIITDFVRRLDDKGFNRSYYVLIHGNA
jgi:predicted GNAT superfamily acetyltransferase